MRNLDPTGVVPNSDYGGKAAGLVKLARNGFRVPDSVLVPATIDEPLTDETILNQISRLEWPLIVRSSATAEDGADNSFAGMLESVHGVSSEIELAHAITTCRQSGRSERVQAYCSERGIDFPLRVGLVIQHEARPTVAGAVFISDPTASQSEITYVEWVNGDGRRLVQGDALDGRAWLHPGGRVLRIDRISDTEVGFLNDMGRTLRRLEGVGGGWDLEFYVENGDLWWVQCRPATAELNHSIARNSVIFYWDLPGIPSPGSRKAAIGARLFEYWDEYNPPVISLLHFDGFYRAIWDATLDTVGASNELLPLATEFAVCKHDIPIAIDTSCMKRERPRESCSGEDLKTVLLEGRVSVSRLEGSLEMSNDPMTTFSILSSALLIYREMTTTRLRSMSSWIDAIDDCTQILKDLLAGRLDEFDGQLDELIDELYAGVDHETRKMRRALRRLANTDGEDDMVVLREFLDEFGHFEADGVPFALCPSDVLRRMAIVGKEEVLSSTERPSNSLLEHMLDTMEDSKAKAVQDAARELQDWFELRESSKSMQELPFPLILKAQAKLAEQLEARNAIPPGSIELHDLDELRRTVYEGVSPVPPSLASLRRRILESKSEMSWLPSWYTGDPPIEELSPGVVTGRIRVVRSVSDFGLVEHGEIVVARTTNPAWTPLFARAAGLIVEHGSRISHAAITAREYGIPAVSGVVGATRDYKDGETVELDADSARIRRIEPEGIGL